VRVLCAVWFVVMRVQIRRLSDLCAHRACFTVFSWLTDRADTVRSCGAMCLRWFYCIRSAKKSVCSFTLIIWSLIDRLSFTDERPRCGATVCQSVQHYPPVSITYRNLVWLRRLHFHQNACVFRSSCKRFPSRTRRHLETLVSGDIIHNKSKCWSLGLGRLTKHGMLLFLVIPDFLAFDVRSRRLWRHISQR